MVNRFFLFFISALLYSSCNVPTETQSDRLQILTSTQMVADAIRPYFNENCSIVVLFPEGIDPHTYRPVPSDIQRLQEADAIVYNGLHLEANLESIFRQLARSKPCLSVANFVPTQDLIPLDAYSFDPHIWFDITLFAAAAKKAADSVCKSLNQEVIDNNSRFLDSLNQIDRALQLEWQEQPESHRILCSVHDAFSYYCRKYKLKQMSLQGVSTAAEFGIYEVDAMVDFMVVNKVKVAFTEAHALTKAMRSIQLGCAQKGHSLVLGEPLLTDAPGKAGSPGGNWPGMVIENTSKILNAFNHD